MIEQLTIKNFMSHKDSTLQFNPGVNIIVGPSDNGKSAIIHALRWVITNRPLGDAYRSVWGGDTEVTLQIDQHLIQRRRTDAQSVYFLGKDKYAAIKTDVPEQIAQALNIDEVNIQSQFQPHFLISTTPGQVAQHFNKIANLDKIDTATKNIKSWITKTEQNIKADQRQKELAEEELIKYDNLPEIEVAIQKVEGQQKQLDGLQQSYTQLDTLLDNLDILNQDIEEKSEVLVLEKQVDNVLELYGEYYGLDAQIDELSLTIVEIKNITFKIDKSSKEVCAEKEVDIILGLQKKADEMDKQYVDLLSKVEASDALLNDIILLEEQIQELEKQFHENIGETCPLCGNKIK